MKNEITPTRWLVDCLFLLFALTLYGINIYYLTNADSAPPMWDEAVHLRDSLVFHNILSNPSQINLKVVRDIIGKSEKYPLIRPSGYYPPFAPILTSFLYCLFGTPVKVAIMSNMVFLFILILSIYKIGTLMFNRHAGLLACVLILLFPLVLSQSVLYMPDLPLTSMVAFSMFTLIKSDYFKNTKFSIISGLSFGLGMLTKWTYLFFVLGPIFYAVFKAFYSESSQQYGVKEPWYLRKSLRNIILFVIISIVTFGPYYFPILPALIEETFKYSHGALAHGPDSLFSFASALFYPVALWKDMITPFGFILFIIGMVLLSFSKNGYKTLLFVWTLVPYFIFTFVIQNKVPRYMMPWLTPISLIICFCISKIASINVLGGSIKLERYAIFLSLIIFAIFFSEEDLRLTNSIINSSEENWKINEMVSVLEENMVKSKTNHSTQIPMYLGVIPDHYYINGQTLRYYVTLRELPLNVIKLQNYTGTAFEEFVEKFHRYDYILTKSSSNIEVTSFQQSIDDMNKFFYSHKDDFEPLKTFHEPDGSDVSIFKRKY